MAQFYVNFIDFTQQVLRDTGNIVGWFSTPLVNIGDFVVTPLGLLTPLGLIGFIAIAIVRWAI